MPVDYLSAVALTGTRDVEIDTLRGVAIVAMVAGHVIGWNATTGMQVGDHSGWRYYGILFADLRMPLFAALSGFVYAARPLSTGSGYGRFVRGKARRLLVPLVTVGLAFVVVQALTPGANEHLPLADAWRVSVYGVDHFWFLQAIFLILVVVGLADRWGCLTTRSRLVVAVGLAAVANVVMSLLSTDLPAQWDLFSFVGALSLLPYFLLGYLFSAHGRHVTSPRWALLAVTVVLFGINAAAVLGSWELTGLEIPVLHLVIGLAGVSTFLMFRSTLAWRPLARLGYFSFAIYLLHVFGTAPARMLLGAAGIENSVAIFVFALACGLALPVVFEVTLGRISWVSWAFLGQKAYRSPWRPAEPEVDRASKRSTERPQDARPAS